MDDKDKELEEQGGDQGAGTGADDTSKKDPGTGEVKDSDLPKSQEELDKMIQKRIAREKKAWQKQSAHPPAPAPQPAAAPPDAGSADPQPAAPDPKLAELSAQLMEARAESTAAKLGVKSDCIEDAVFLAIRAANKEADGEPDEDDIKKALNGVLKKHPEWKADGDKDSGGFRVGAPQPGQQKQEEKKPAQKRWNRFNGI